MDNAICIEAPATQLKSRAPSGTFGLSVAFAVLSFGLTATVGIFSLFCAVIGLAAARRAYEEGHVYFGWAAFANASAIVLSLSMRCAIQ